MKIARQYCIDTTLKYIDKENAKLRADQGKSSWGYKTRMIKCNVFYCFLCQNEKCFQNNLFTSNVS